MKSVERHIVVDKERSEALQKKAEAYSRRVATIASKRNYEKPESSLSIAGDTRYHSKILKKIAHLVDIKHVVLIGIGGSSVGTEAVYSALAFKDGPQLMVLDAIDERGFEALQDLIRVTGDPKTIAMVVVSKSGTTTETLTNAVAALELCEEKFGESFNEQVVFIGTEGTDFLKIGKKRKVTCITFPDVIGGRYSVFSAVGIVPLTLLGIDVQSFRDGALVAVSKKYRAQIIEHTVSLALLAEGGVHTVNFFTFNERLKKLGYWYRQLLAESIGKRMTTKGATFSHQLLPTVATSVDLHSMAQLYLGGYKNLYTHFVYGDVESEFHELSDHWLLCTLSSVEDKNPQEIKNAIREGVLKAYDDQRLPYRLTTFNRITAYEMGLMMGSLMFETMCLGHLFDIDVFDQPNVEAYKSHTHKLLVH